MTEKPTDAAATVPTPRRQPDVKTAGPTPATGRLHREESLTLGTNLKKQAIEAMMPTSMPMYTTFFMPVADRPMMVAMSRKSGSSARNRLGMFLSSSTSMSSSVATKCSPRAWARLSENLMIRQLTVIAMMEPTIPMMGAAVSETPQPLAA